MEGKKRMKIMANIIHVPASYVVSGISFTEDEVTYLKGFIDLESQTVTRNKKLIREDETFQKALEAGLFIANTLDITALDIILQISSDGRELFQIEGLITQSVIPEIEWTEEEIQHLQNLFKAGDYLKVPRNQIREDSILQKAITAGISLCLLIDVNLNATLNLSQNGRQLLGHI